MATRAQPRLLRDTIRAGAQRSGAIAAALALALASVALLLAVFSYHAQDPSFDTAAGGPAENLLAPFGLVIALKLWRQEGVSGWSGMLWRTLLAMALIGTTLAFLPQVWPTPS